MPPASTRWIVLLGFAGCGGGDSAGPDLGSSRGDPSVASTDPAEAPRNTTLDVRIRGTGFEASSRAVWALHGDTSFATTRIRTNSTRFINSTQLVASITIGADAALDRHDVVVITASGKKGIGLELFAVTIEVIDLQAGPGSWAYAVNDAGQIVGSTGTPEQRAFLWRNGVLTRLDVLPGETYSVAYDINQLGQVVGVSCRGLTACRGFRWTSGVVTELLPPPSYCCSSADAVNDRGDAVGWVAVTQSDVADGVRRAAIWANGATVALDLHGVRPGVSTAQDINNHQMVVGWSDATPGATGGGGSFVWTEAEGFQLLGGVEDEGDALGINDAGQIVGWGSPDGPFTDGVFRTLVAYLWQNGTRQYLGTLGGRSSVAMDITEDGLVVGRADTGLPRSGALQHVAFLWSAESGMRGLDLAPGTDYSWGLDVNARGWVVGVARVPSGEHSATLWKTQ